MNAKAIKSVTYILIGNMLTLYSSIGEGWSAKLTAIFGLILFFVGLIQLKSFLDEKGASGVRKLIWAAILGILANIFSMIPIVGGIPAGIINLIAFILQILGLLNLKRSVNLGKTGAVGANILLSAITIMIMASILSIVPFLGHTIKSIVSFIAFIIIPFGWIKIQEAIVINVALPTSTFKLETGSHTDINVIQDAGNVGDWFSKNIKVIIGTIGLLAVLGGIYFLFFKPNPERDAIKAANVFCKCNEKNNAQIIILYNNLISELKKNNYNSRQDARTRLQALKDSSEMINANCIIEAESLYKKFRSGFIKNEKLLRDFDLTFNANRKNNCAASNEDDLKMVYATVEKQISLLKDSEALTETKYSDKINLKISPPPTTPLPYEIKSKVITITGHWTKENEDFPFIMELNIDEKNGVNGLINWSIRKVAPSDYNYYKSKMNATAKEYITGTYEPEGRVLKFHGISKNDPSSIIGLDSYIIELDDSYNAKGKTKAKGDWSGNIDGKITIN